jgi:hypothetical protein
MVLPANGTRIEAELILGGRSFRNRKRSGQTENLERLPAIKIFFTTLGFSGNPLSLVACEGNHFTNTSLFHYDLCGISDFCSSDCDCCCGM